MASPTASPSSVSPGRRTRQQEKDELQHINDRFVTYIGRVRRLRDEKTQVDVAFRTLQDSQDLETVSVKRVYESELNEARSLIDETAKEKAHFQIVASKNSERLQELETDLKDSQDEVQKLRKELGDAHRRIDMLDKQLKASVFDKLSAQQKLRELEEEVEELTAQLKSLRDSLEQETLSKVDLQNHIQSLKEELAFKRRVHEEEVSSLRKRTYQMESLEGTDYADDFAERLQAAIDEIRDELERETELYRRDLEMTYKDRLEMMESQTSRYSITITNLNEQIREVNSSFGSTKDAYAKIQKEHEQLKHKYVMKEDQLTRQQQQHNEEVVQMANELQILRERYEEKLREYEELLDLRVKLEQEILTLGALLEEEERRLNLAPTPTREKRTRGHRDPGSQHSKKTKRSQELSSSSSADGSIQITDVEPEGCYIQIKNTSDKVEQLGNFKIVHEVEDMGEKTEFRFHVKSKLQGGASVTVWATDAEGAVHHPPTDIIWKSCSMWDSGPKTVTSLCTKNGEVVATFTQRKEAAVSFTMEETDAGVRCFPSLPESPVPRQVTRRVDPLPQVGDEHVFHQQGDPQGRDPAKCVVS